MSAASNEWRTVLTSVDVFWAENEYHWRNDRVESSVGRCSRVLTSAECSTARADLDIAWALHNSQRTPEKLSRG